MYRSNKDFLVPSLATKSQWTVGCSCLWSPSRTIWKRYCLWLKLPSPEKFTFGGYLTLICSPSLPLVPQWLEMLIGVNQALGILLRLWENESSNAPIWKCSSNVIMRGRVTSPFSALPAQRIWPAHEKLSYDCMSAILFFPRETSWIATKQSRALWARSVFGCTNEKCFLVPSSEPLKNLNLVS